MVTIFQAGVKSVDSQLIDSQSVLSISELNYAHTELNSFLVFKRTTVDLFPKKVISKIILKVKPKNNVLEFWIVK